MKKKVKNKKFKIDILSMIFAIICFMGGMIYQDFIEKKLFNQQVKIMNSIFNNFLGKKITFHTNLKGVIYMFTISDLEKINKKKRELNKILLGKNKNGNKK